MEKSAAAAKRPPLGIFRATGIRASADFGLAHNDVYA